MVKKDNQRMKIPQRILLVESDQEIELLIKEALLKLSPSIQLEIAKTPVDAEKKYLKLDPDFILCEFKTANLDKINQLYQKNDINAIPCALLIHEKDEKKIVNKIDHNILDYIIKSEKNLKRLYYELKRVFRTWYLISRKNDTEQTLLENQDKYKAVFEKFHDAYFSMDMGGRITAMTDAGVKLLGYKKSNDVIGKNLITDFFISKEDGDRFFQLVKETGEVRNFETQIKRKDMPNLWVDIGACFLFDEKGRFISMEGNIRDITTRKRVETDLANQRKFSELRAEIWKIASDKSLSKSQLIQNLLDQVGPTIGVSRACYNTYDNNQSKGELKCVLEWCAETVTPTIGMKIPKKLAQHYLREGLFIVTKKTALDKVPKLLQPVSKPMINQFAESMNLASVMVLPLYIDEKIEGLLTFDICQDHARKPEWTEDVKRIVFEVVRIVKNHITFKKVEAQLKEAYDEMENRVQQRSMEIIQANKQLKVSLRQQKKAEKFLKKAKEAAEKANRLKSQFIANVSHEVRTPLNSIIGYSEIILGSTNVLNIHQHIKTVLRESEILLILINSLLDHAKMEAGKLQLESIPFDLYLLLDHIKRALRLHAKEKGIIFDLSVSKCVPQYVMGDALRLRQVLLNLIGNAIKFTDQGSVQVHIKTMQTNQKKIQLHFTISDIGIGIEEDDKEKIFERFFHTGDRIRCMKGTGLGMNISKQIIEEMGGKIGLDSEPGEGSAFWFTCTLEPCPAADSDGMTRIFENLSLKAMLGDQWRKGHILIVDDYPPNHEVARLHLESYGHQVTVVENGFEALEACANNAFDLVLMDIQMPEMDGFEAVSKIRAGDSHCRNIPVIGLTADADIETLDICLKKGMDDVVTKPIRRDTFLMTVFQWLDKSSKGYVHEKRKGAKRQGSKVVSSKNVPLDFEVAIREFETEEVLQEVISNFIETVEKHIPKMKEALEKNKLDILQREAHALKGGASTLEACPLARAAKDLEKKCKLKERDDLESALNQLEFEFERLKDFLQAHQN